MSTRALPSISPLNKVKGQAFKVKYVSRNSFYRTDLDTLRYRAKLHQNLTGSFSSYK